MRSVKYARSDSNRHSLRKRLLRTPRLPISPLARVPERIRTSTPVRALTTQASASTYFTTSTYEGPTGFAPALLASCEALF